MNEATPIPVDSGSCSSEGCSTPRADTEGALCPVSRTIGQRVDLITLKALLKGNALRRLEGKAYRFCPEPDCGVVYFDREADSVFKRTDLTVRVTQKERGDSTPLCYCFDYSLGDLRRDLAESGGNLVPAAIMREIRAGHCACEVRNPQGTCCLGNISAAVRSLSREP